MVIRIRPEIAEDVALHDLHARGTRHKCVSQIDDKTLRVDPPDSAIVRKPVSAVDSKLYSYDRVLGDQTDQEQIYQCVQHHVHATIRGYNTTIFALGCTGSGLQFIHTTELASFSL